MAEKKKLLCDSYSKCVRASEFLSAIGNPIRVAIVCYLTTGEKTVKEIVEKLKMKEPTVSLNLYRLYRAGWVTRRKVGRSVYYKLKSEKYKKILEEVSELYVSQDHKISV
ncbi:MULTISPECIES: ArsR/SmtB family transcription factor [Caldisericum]|jgi:DNA-binding transcriptional ArsR family regulator|uniref:Transcriptional regulator n=1 Tax=Caldisericum exile TaxID=693075 RepID=A0A2J6WF36_9BACT|nr:MAG: transcriptional regulator [Caldisericum exile]